MGVNHKDTVPFYLALSHDFQVPRLVSVSRHQLFKYKPTLTLAL